MSSEAINGKVKTMTTQTLLLTELQVQRAQYFIGLRTQRTQQRALQCRATEINDSPIPKQLGLGIGLNCGGTPRPD
jgi:hypothetical protein